MTTSGRWTLRQILVALAVCAAAAAVAPASAQVEVQGVRRDMDEQSLFVDAISFAARGGTGPRVDVFVQVGHDILSFVKNGDRYDASYEMTISVFDSTNTLVSEKLWTEEVKGMTFDQSVSPSATSITQRSLQIAPGHYVLRVIVFDRESKVSRQLTRRLLVSDYTASDFALSDIMLLNKVTMQGDRRSITPSISSNIGAIPESFFQYIEVYNTRALDTVKFVSTILDGKGDPVLTVDTLVTLKPGRSELILRVPHGNVPIGDYRLIVSARSPQAKEDDPALATTNRIVVVRWQGLPRSVKDLNLAIEQVRYIAKDDEFSIMKDAKTAEEKQAKFLEFWKKRDPNPNTPRNEKMEEYYARVEYANKHFSHYIEGWRTDMGMIFIIFGPPNNVDRHPFEVDSKPYEIWAYYELNYSIVFVDETGFGDYRLQTPIWEIYQRLRN
jgi:GWxTD domain-containing protein